MDHPTPIDPETGSGKHWLTLILLFAVGVVVWLAVTGRSTTVGSEGSAAPVDAPARERRVERPPARQPQALRPRRTDLSPMRLNDQVTRPVKISGPNPMYTEIARKARIQGVVIVEAIIAKDGSVADVKILKPLPMGLDQAAVEAVRQWRFEPATLDGRPVDVYYNLTINYRLK